MKKLFAIMLLSCMVSMANATLIEGWVAPNAEECKKNPHLFGCPGVPMKGIA